MQPLRFGISDHRLVANVAMATAVSSRWLRAASAGSLGWANRQPLIGQSPLPLLAPGSCIPYSRLSLGRFRHRSINQKGRQMLGPLVKSTVRLFQTLMVVTLKRHFDLAH
jgi:hypothetical protein